MKLHENDLEQFRVELTGYCYRMLGSGFEAEDAVQETFIRAWRHADRFDEGRASLRTWLYTISTRVCVDMLRGAQRRARSVDLEPPSSPGAALGVPLADDRWVQPYPDRRMLPDHADPAEQAVLRESVRLAFVAALQYLPPRQRAVLILRDVLRWKADEVAQLLGASVAAVNSALQRARAVLETKRPPQADTFSPLDGAQRTLLDRYIAAFERYDVDALVKLLAEDAAMSMPPFGWWLRGAADIREALLGSEGICRGSRLVPVAANGSPALGQYVREANGVHAPWALVVLDFSCGRITAMTTYLDPDRLFPLFELPPEPR